MFHIDFHKTNPPVKDLQTLKTSDSMCWPLSQRPGLKIGQNCPLLIWMPFYPYTQKVTFCTNARKILYRAKYDFWVYWSCYITSMGVERSIFTWPGTEYYSFFLGAILSGTLPTTQICVMAPSRGWAFWKKWRFAKARQADLKFTWFSEKSVTLKTLNAYRVPSCSFEMLDICLINNHHKRNYSKKFRVPNSTTRLKMFHWNDGQLFA